MPEPTLGAILSLLDHLGPLGKPALRRTGFSNDPLLLLEVRPEDGLGSDARHFAQHPYLKVTNIGYPHALSPETAYDARATVTFPDGKRHRLMWATPKGLQETRDIVWKESEVIPFLVRHHRAEWSLFDYPLARGYTYLCEETILMKPA